MAKKEVSAKEHSEKIALDKIYREKLFRELCAHVSKGYSIDCFPPLSENSIREYLSLYKEEFCREKLDIALRKGKGFWEDIGTRQASGHCMGNSRTWFYNMAHRYKWSDRVDVSTEHKGTVAVNIVNYASKKPSTDSTE